MAAPALSPRDSSDNFAHFEKLVDPCTGPPPSHGPSTTPVEKKTWLNSDPLDLPQEMLQPSIQIGDQARPDITLSPTGNVEPPDNNLNDKLSTKKLDDGWLCGNLILDDSFQPSSTIPRPISKLTEIQTGFTSVEVDPVLTPFMVGSLNALEPDNDSQSDLGYDDLESSSPISSSPPIFSSSPFASSPSSQTSSQSYESKSTKNYDLFHRCITEVSSPLEISKSKGYNSSHASDTVAKFNQGTCEIETETEIELTEMPSSPRSATLVSSSSYEVSYLFSPTPLSSTSEHLEWSSHAASHPKIGDYELFEINAGSNLFDRVTLSQEQLNPDNILQTDSADYGGSAIALDFSPSIKLISNSCLTASSKDNPDVIGLSVDNSTGLDLYEAQDTHVDQTKSEEIFERNDNQSEEITQEELILIDNIVKEDAGPRNVKEQCGEMDLIYEFPHSQNEILESEVLLHQTSFPTRLQPTAVKRKCEDYDEQKLLLMSDNTQPSMERPHVEAITKAAPHTTPQSSSALLGSPKLECLPPLPKRATLASQKLQHKKLATPFRSPVMKKAKLDLQAQPGTKLNPESAFRPGGNSTGKETITETVDTQSRDLTTGRLTPLEKSDLKTRHRTVRAAAQFKSPLNASSSSNLMTSVRLTPTIQGLEMRLQTLKRALKVRQDRQEAVLENLIHKWTAAGREVAWEVWSLVKDNSSDEAGWGTKRREGIKRGYEDSWEDQGKGKKERERHWGWDVVPRTEDVQETADTDEDTPIVQQEDEEEPKLRGTLGTMLMQLTINPATLGWSEDEGAFVDD